MGVFAWPVFLKYTVHSTTGKSAYSTATQRTSRPVLASVQVSVCCVRSWESLLLWLFRGQACQELGGGLFAVDETRRPGCRPSRSADRRRSATDRVSHRSLLCISSGWKKAGRPADARAPPSRAESQGSRRALAEGRP